jgi:hypothetical protein
MDMNSDHSILVTPQYATNNATKARELNKAIRAGEPYTFNGAHVTIENYSCVSDGAGVMGEQMNEMAGAGWGTDIERHAQGWTFRTAHGDSTQSFQYSHRHLDTAVAITYAAWQAARSMEKLLTK